jgi:hypothetical protein
MRTSRFGLETFLNGRKYRSRLEARWSIFFDRLGIRYQYEPVIFPGYLVDFFIPQQPRFCENTCFEIKPSDLAESETNQLGDFATENLPIYVLTELPDLDGDPPGDGYYYFGRGWDNNQRFCVCSHCGIYGIRYEGRSERLSCLCTKDGDRGENYGDPRLIQAAQFALKHRF